MSISEENIELVRWEAESNSMLYESEPTAYCPNPKCDADITDGDSIWNYCPFCGQRIAYE